MSFFKKSKKYSTLRPAKKKDIPQGVWDKCKNCSEIVYKKAIEGNLNVCPKCDFHYPLNQTKQQNHSHQ